MHKLVVILLFPLFLFSQEVEVRMEMYNILTSQLHVREATGNNDGYEVEEYLSSVGLGAGYPWCAAFTTWALDYCSIPNPRSAWSPDWARTSHTIWSQQMVKTRVALKPQTGDTFTLFYNKLGRVGHVGFFVEDLGNGYFKTIEGNTNVAGSRLGIGVFARKRDVRKIYRITNYITPQYGGEIPQYNER